MQVNSRLDPSSGSSEARTQRRPKDETITFWSQGVRLAGSLRLPAADGPVAVVVQGPGWLGLRKAKLYSRYHEALLGAGIAVMTLDYRGFGDSDGDGTFLDPMAQVEDIRSGIDYLEGRSEIDRSRIGVFGSGGTGGGNAIVVAALDDRVRAVVSQVPICDGLDWLRRMRREHEWLEFLARIREDRLQRARTGVGELVPARDGILVPTPERRETSVKRDVDDQIQEMVALASAEAIMRYRPIDHVAALGSRALLLISVQGDAVTPDDHAVALYQRATGPKRLVVQTGTTHYAAYARYGDVIAPMIADWFTTHLSGGAIEMVEDAGVQPITYLGGRHS